MWYFAWILGLAMAVLLSIVNAIYGENHELQETNAQAPEK